jgi:transketolase
VALQSKKTPSILSLTRQNLPNLENSTVELASKGGYVLQEEVEEDLTIVSSGSEVSIAVEAAAKLKDEGFKTRVVSLPCWSVFDKQSQEYKLSVLRSGAPILSLEALSVSKAVCNEIRWLNMCSADGRMAEVQSRAVWASCLGCLRAVSESL